MGSPEKLDELTPQAIGERIAAAIRDAPEPYRDNETLIAGTLRIDTGTLDNYIKGKTAVGAITVLKIAKLTGKSFASFAGEPDQPAERLATAADQAETAIRELNIRLDQLLQDLASARAILVGDEVEIDIGAATAGVGKKPPKKPRKSVTVTCDATG